MTLQLPYTFRPHKVIIEVHCAVLYTSKHLKGQLDLPVSDEKCM